MNYGNQIDIDTDLANVRRASLNLTYWALNQEY